MSKHNHPPKPARWEKRASRPLAQTKILDLSLTKFHHPLRATEREFVTISGPDWVNVVAVTAREELVLVRQFRYGANDFSLEVPGGVVERGEDPVAAGLRELREETGYAGGEARLLGVVHPNPAIQTNRCHIVLAVGVERRAGLEWDADEELETVVLPVEEAYACAYRGEITHALVLDALLLFRPVWERMRGGVV